MKKPGRDLRQKVELWLAWKRVAKEIADGTLGGDFDRTDRAEIHSKVAIAEDDAKDEVWGGYRYIVLSDSQDLTGLKTIDLGAGHSSSGETLCGRVITALKSQALLNESVGAGYLERKWPPALKESGAWPLTSLRQSFLNGSLTRLLDPDTVLRNKIVEFVSSGDFGLASEQRSDGSYERIWHEELIAPEEVAFETGVFLLTKEKAQAYKKGQKPELEPSAPPVEEPDSEPGPPVVEPPGPGEEREEVVLLIKGTVPLELWNRLGTKVLPKLRSGKDLGIGIEFRVGFKSEMAESIKAEIRQILQDLGLSESVTVS